MSEIEEAFEGWLRAYYPGVRGPRGALVEGLETAVKAAFFAGVRLALKEAHCACGVHAHRSDRSTGAVRECLECPCEQFYNIHMALDVVEAQVEEAKNVLREVYLDACVFERRPSDRLVMNLWPKFALLKPSQRRK